MNKGKARLRWTGIILAVFAVSVCLTVSGIYGAKNPSESGIEKRADIIRIDSMKAFGKLERQPVIFLHQKHTEALEKKNKDCTTCHLTETEKDRLVPKYMRLEDIWATSTRARPRTVLPATRKRLPPRKKVVPLFAGSAIRTRPTLFHPGSPSVWTNLCITGTPRRKKKNAKNAITSTMN